VRYEDRREPAYWKWGLLLGCALSLALTAATLLEVVGFNGRPWFGYWDGFNAPSGQPYQLTVTVVRRGGAAYAAGLRDGDVIDLRRQSLAGRLAALYQPSAAWPTVINVTRPGVSTRTVPFTGSSLWQGETDWKLLPVLASFLSALGFGLCALIVALNQWRNPPARMLAVVLLANTAPQLYILNFVVPDPKFALIADVFGAGCWAAGWILFVYLCGRFGRRSPLRRALEGLAYAAAASTFAAHVAAAAGFVTLRIDPLQFSIYSVGYHVWTEAVIAAILAAAIAAVAAEPAENRPRTAWLLLPIPASLVASALFVQVLGAIWLSVGRESWFGGMVMTTGADVCVLAGAAAVAYAVVKRRVLDIEFVLSRTLVVGIVSAIIVASFVLLEWLLASVLAGASHTTGLAANAALALVLGLSLRYVHARVDTLVDHVFFRKRHEDERALLDFSKEAGFVTRAGVLLDLAIETLARHTDARSAALLLEGDGAYVPARRFGDGAAPSVSENDPSILALKARHAPIDPHRYASSLAGALALPMLARGRLLGVLLMGERAGGEAYAPDEVEALAQFAHGVGSAHDALSANAAPSAASLQRSISDLTDGLASLVESVSRLPDAIASRIRVQ
jgi:GAF domain-containing protein